MRDFSAFVCILDLGEKEMFLGPLLQLAFYWSQA